MLKWISSAIVMMVFGSVQAAINEEPVTYSDGSTTMKGFVVYDDAKTGKRPGVIVVHEWWGITRHVHGEARNLAQQGYTALIADMYGDGKTANNPNDAGALAESVLKDPAGPKAAPGKVKAKVLVMNGADDPFVERDSIDRFKREMSAAKVDMRYLSYPGAVHAFTNPEATEAGKKFNLPIAYNAKADKESKVEASKFLASTLK